jgi:DNA-binding FadR family transcriptional regulator
MQTLSAANGGRRLGQLRMAEQVAAALRERILHADLRNGSLLPKQDELVAEFGVSYPSVREALRILETEGLITIRRGNVGGAEVHAPNATTAGYALGLALQAMRVPVADLGEALADLEPMTAARCARRSDRKDKIVPVLRDLVAATEEHINDDVQFTQVSREFHEALMTYCGNETLRLAVGSLSSLWSAQEEAWAESLASEGQYPNTRGRREVIRAHKRITDAIEAGDPAEAERLARVHVCATQRLVVSEVKDAVVEAGSAKAKARLRALSERR